MRRRTFISGLSMLSATGCLRLQEGKQASSPVEGDDTTQDASDESTDDKPTDEPTASEPTDETTTGGNEETEVDTGDVPMDVRFERGAVDRDDDGVHADRGVIATITDYADATSVRVRYRVPEQGFTIYESPWFDVSDVKQSGPLGPTQLDPDRGPDELHASDAASDEGKEYSVFEDEAVDISFRRDGEVVGTITHVVGSGGSESTESTTATDQRGAPVSVDFRRGPVDRDDDGVHADRGVIATITDYDTATSVRVRYRVPEQGFTIYESPWFDVTDVKQAGPLGPTQLDPERGADELQASDAETDEGKEYSVFQDEAVDVSFRREGETFATVTHVV
ncbi:hypothetical protein [Haloarchaeobius sp. TZWWS8]|uniref:hypothetical protein n=1 Tax=Haloarchaeobius sp. TZWWS8 TaxID=3446121 RepID=UPI003EBA8864